MVHGKVVLRGTKMGAFGGANKRPYDDLNDQYSDDLHDYDACYADDNTANFSKKFKSAEKPPTVYF